MAEALDTLARIRKLEADQARRVLGQAVTRENHAREVADAAQAAKGQEAALAVSDAAHPLAYAYAAWLPACLETIGAAEAAFDQHASAAAAARQMLTGRKAALEAVELLVAERNLVRRRKLARHAQSRLDELGHRLG